MTDDIVNWCNENTKTHDGQIVVFSVLTLAAIDRYVCIVESNKNQAVWLLKCIRRAMSNEIELIRPIKNTD